SAASRHAIIPGAGLVLKIVMTLERGADVRARATVSQRCNSERNRGSAAVPAASSGSVSLLELRGISRTTQSPAPGRCGNSQARTPALRSGAPYQAERAFRTAHSLCNDHIADSQEDVRGRRTE